MTPEQFVFWLSGFLTGNNAVHNCGLTTTEVDEINKELFLTLQHLVSLKIEVVPMKE